VEWFKLFTDSGINAVLTIVVLQELRHFRGTLERAMLSLIGKIESERK